MPLTAKHDDLIVAMVNDGLTSAAIVRFIGQRYKTAIYRRIENLATFGQPQRPKEVLRKSSPNYKLTSIIEAYIIKLCAHRPNI